MIALLIYQFSILSPYSLLPIFWRCLRNQRAICIGITIASSVSIDSTVGSEIGGPTCEKPYLLNRSKLRGRIATNRVEASCCFAILRAEEKILLKGILPRFSLSKTRRDISQTLFRPNCLRSKPLSSIGSPIDLLGRTTL